MGTEVQMLSKRDRLTHIDVMPVHDGISPPFNVIYFESEDGSYLVAYLPLEWREMMQEAIRKAYPPEPLCAVCHSIHIAGTACETHDSYVHITDPYLESPVS